MKGSSLIVLSCFLKTFSQSKITQLIDPLSLQVKKELEAVFHPTIAIDSSKFLERSILNYVHYSWYIPLMKSFSKKDLSLLLNSFNSPNKESLEKHLGEKASDTASPLAVDYFQKILFDKVLDPKNVDLLPLEYLPTTDLSELLFLSKNDLVSLIDYLALFDLATQLPKIVNPLILKKISSILSTDKKKFLKKLSFYKEPFSMPLFNFSSAADSKEITFALHKRGLNRFAKALCNENEIFTWYICHRLDIGRGSILSKFCKDKVQKEISKTITFNIIELLPIIKNKSI